MPASTLCFLRKNNSYRSCVWAPSSLRELCVGLCTHRMFPPLRTEFHDAKAFIAICAPKPKETVSSAKPAGSTNEDPSSWYNSITELCLSQYSLRPPKTIQTKHASYWPSVRFLSLHRRACPYMIRSQYGLGKWTYPQKPEIFQVE